MEKQTLKELEGRKKGYEQELSGKSMKIHPSQFCAPASYADAYDADIPFDY